MDCPNDRLEILLQYVVIPESFEEEPQIVMDEGGVKRVDGASLEFYRRNVRELSVVREYGENPGEVRKLLRNHIQGEWCRSCRISYIAYIRRFTTSVARGRDEFMGQIIGANEGIDYPVRKPLSQLIKEENERLLNLDDFPDN